MLDTRTTLLIGGSCKSEVLVQLPGNQPNSRNAHEPDASSAHSTRDMHDAYSTYLPQATAHVTSFTGAHTTVDLKRFDVTMMWRLARKEHSDALSEVSLLS